MKMPPVGLGSAAEAMRTRRSIRHYLPDPISAPLLRELLELALEAPSAWNFQARSIVVVSDPALRASLSKAANGQPHPQEAPVTLVFVAECQAWQENLDDVYDQARQRKAWNHEVIAMFQESSPGFQQDLADRGLLREYAVKDAMIAATYLMLAAASSGLATSPMNGWNENEVKKVIGIADRDDLAIALLVPVGLPAEQRRHPGRKPFKHKVFQQQYGMQTN